MSLEVLDVVDKTCSSTYVNEKSRATILMIRLWLSLWIEET